MKSLKSVKNLIILILITAAITALSACQKNQPTNTQTPTTNTPSPTNQETQATTTKIKKDPVTITKNKDGWKTYTNTDWGIKFRFKDEKNEVETDSDSSFISLKGNKYKADDFVYISRSNIEDMPYRAGKKYHKRTLKEALEDGGWFSFEPQYKLLKIEDITTRKKVTGYKVFTLANFSSQGGGSEVVMTEYYFNYPKKLLLDIIIKNFDYIHIRFADDNSKYITQILDSLEFFDI